MLLCTTDPHLQALTSSFPSSLVLGQKQRFGHPWVVSAKLIRGLSWAYIGKINVRPPSALFQITRAMPPQWGGSLGRLAAGVGSFSGDPCSQDMCEGKRE